MSEIVELFFQERNMFIDWQLGDVCNFKCAYCNDDSMGGKVGWPELDAAKYLVDQVVQHSDHEYRTYNLLGGEPTLWKHFGELVEYINQEDSDNLIQILTNGSRTLRWWESYAKYLDKVVISVHIKTSTVDNDHIRQVVEICQKYNSVSIQLLMDITCFDQCVEAFDYFVQHLPGVKVSAKKGETFLGSREWMPYTQEQLDWMEQSLERSKYNESRPTVVDREKKKKKRNRVFKARDNNNQIKVTSNKDLILTDQNHFKGWECNIGIDMISIKPHGDIYPSSACFKEVPMGNYKNYQAIQWPQTPFVCKYDGCFCGADIEIEKRK